MAKRYVNLLSILFNNIISTVEDIMTYFKALSQNGWKDWRKTEYPVSCLQHQLTLLNRIFSE
jgi:hypothetical protein